MHAAALTLGLVAAADTTDIRMLPYGIGAVLGAVMIVTDLRWHRLPDAIALPAVPMLAAALFAVAAVNGTWGDLGRAALGSLALPLWYLLLALLSRGGMGAGDIKLAPSIGLLAASSSWTALCTATLIAFVIAGAVAALLVLAGHPRHSRIPFGPAMILGVVVALLHAAP